MNPVIPCAVLRAYLHTTYCVFAPAGEILLRIGVRNDDILALHGARGVTCSAFVSACNPLGVDADPEDNARAMQALREHLQDAHFGWLDGEGRGDDPAWPPEPSLLVLGMDGLSARALAAAFDQNAVVAVGSDGVAQLLLHPAAAITR